MSKLTVHRAAGDTTYGVPDDFELAAWVGMPSITINDKANGFQALIRVTDDVLALSVQTDGSPTDDHNIEPVKAAEPIATG